MRRFTALAVSALTTGGAVVTTAGAAHGGISVGNNWCAAPWSWPGPASTNAAAFSYDACNDQLNAVHVAGTPGAIAGNVLNAANNWCAAPWNWNGPLSDNLAATVYGACDQAENDVVMAPPPVTAVAHPNQGSEPRFSPPPALQPAHGMPCLVGVHPATMVRPAHHRPHLTGTAPVHTLPTKPVHHAPRHPKALHLQAAGASCLPSGAPAVTHPIF